jgi:hypothetical protein
MSYKRNTNPNTKSSNSSTAFCKVCKDSGCSEAEYTSHFVKDQPGPTGKVVCPTLLNQACRICNAKGHTSSYCPQYKPRDLPRDQPAYDDSRRCESARMPPRPAYHNNTSRNIYTERIERERESQVSYESSSSRRAPYAHPHGPRTRLQLDAPALSAASVKADLDSVLPVDIRKVVLKHAENWGDEPEGVMHTSEFRKLAQDSIMRSLISDRDFDLIVQCDADNGQ